VALVADFVHRQVDGLRAVVAEEGVSDPLGVIGLGDMYERRIESKTALCEALAYAVRQLAAHENQGVT
jgi:ethanolamine utilization protein EutP (predicted NTPase)